MVYIVPYEADFECPKGHRFTMPVGFNTEGAQARCPHCYEEWIAANVPCGQQVSKPRQEPDEVVTHFYEAGTSTPKTTYQDTSLTTPHLNVWIHR